MTKNKKLYDQVLNILKTDPRTRSSDKLLIWIVLKQNNFLSYLGEYCMTFDKFMDGPSFESIRRCRQKIQEKYPELEASDFVKKVRKAKAAEKGTHVYREKVACYDNVTGKTILL